MIEHFTEALVLDNKDINEFDALIILYTADLGKVIAKAKSIRKITSKLAGHLQPLNFVNCRLIEKNGFQIVDALTINESPTKNSKEKLLVSCETSQNHKNLQKNINIAKFLNEMTFELQQDFRLWQAIKKIINSDFEENLIYRGILTILGFDSKHALCALCHKNEIKYFIIYDHAFLCSQCGLKANQNDVILIK